MRSQTSSRASVVVGDWVGRVLGSGESTMRYVEKKIEEIEEQPEELAHLASALKIERRADAQ